MKSAVIPIICALVLSAIAAASASHWWSVRQMVAVKNTPAPALPSPPAEIHPPPPPAPAPEIAESGPPPQPAPIRESEASETFYRELVAELKSLKQENRDLRDQMAETNRDLMKLEFRVDTHSESFRPLPVSQGLEDQVLDTSAGVLPPFDDLTPLSQP